MNQLDLFLEHRCKYLIKYKGRVREAWCYDDTFTSPPYIGIKDCEVIKRIGNESELFDAKR